MKKWRNFVTVAPLLPITGDSACMAASGHEDNFTQPRAHLFDHPCKDDSDGSASDDDDSSETDKDDRGHGHILPDGTKRGET